MRLLDALSGVASRISLGIAMAVAILVGLWPDHARDTDPVRLGAVITTAVAWLAAELVSGRKSSEHDLALFARIVELLPPATIDFLRNHDFGNSFAGNHLKGPFAIAAWEGSRYAFLDPVLQRSWKPVHALIVSFSAELAAGTGPVGAGPLFSAHPDHGDRDHPEQWVLDRIASLNKAATALSRAADDFENRARKRLRL